MIERLSRDADGVHQIPHHIIILNVASFAQITGFFEAFTNQTGGCLALPLKPSWSLLLLFTTLRSTSLGDHRSL